MNKDAEIPKDDWKKTWKAGEYLYKAPDHEPGTHPIEKGEVTWHQLKTTGNVQDAAKDITRQDQAPREESASD